MGRDKALVPLAGRPLIEHLLERLTGLGDETLITTNRPDDFAYLGLRMASDPVPGAGTLAGLRTALSGARGESVLVVACDVPFVQRRLLEHLIGLRGEAEVVVPRRGGEYEPLLAVYARACLPAIETALAQGEARIISFFPAVRVRAVEGDELAIYDPEGRSFFNVNTAEDLAEAERMLAADRDRAAGN
jgi:molybdopterin-guanine dinucleotide biosynthesis protein A